jgi:hypothetical protein
LAVALHRHAAADADLQVAPVDGVEVRVVGQRVEQRVDRREAVEACATAPSARAGMSRGLGIRMLQPPMRMPSIMFTVKPKM